jgi:peptide/nickel transport system substrate-binding protein
MTMSKSGRTRGIAAAMAIGLLAAACGGGGSGGSKGETGSAPTDEGTPKAGGQVIYALESETNAGWCLAESQLAISGIQVARSIYDTLVQPDENDEMVPMLAESVEPNDTYDEWTLKIRQGVKFHDGSDLTAEVVKNNLDAYRGQYEGRKPLLFVFVLDNIDTVEASDDSTVVITTKKPWPALPSALYNSGRLGMMGQAQLDNADNCDKDLVGTGPFKLKEWKVNDRFVAEKNPDYWQTDADGNALPYLDEIEYRPVPDSGGRIEGLQTGQFDIIHASGGEAAEQLIPLAESGQIDMISNSDFAEVGYAMTNEAKAPFDKLDARLAVAYGMDRDELIALRTGGLQEVASGPFAPGTMGYLNERCQSSRRRHDARRCSRLTVAMAVSGIEAGHTSAHSPWVEHGPNSASSRSTVARARRPRSAEPRPEMARWASLAPATRWAAPLGQATTHAPQPMHAAKSSARSAASCVVGDASASGAVPASTLT